MYVIIMMINYNTTTVNVYYYIDNKLQYYNC